MTAGFCFGRIYRLPAERRRLVLIGLGVALTAAFVVIRAANIYGDPRPWTIQNRPGFTLLSFLNCTKYPASLSFLLMTLGPAIVFLGLVDRVRPRDRNLLIALGRTPLLYFVLHIPLIHVIAIALTWLRYGGAPFLFLPPPTLGTPRDYFPRDYGWSLVDGLRGHRCGGAGALSVLPVVLAAAGTPSRVVVVELSLVGGRLAARLPLEPLRFSVPYRFTLFAVRAAAVSDRR